MFSSTCQGLELILVDSRFERGCLRCFRRLSSQSSFPCINGCSRGPLVGTAELPSSTCTHTVAASLQGSSALEGLCCFPHWPQPAAASGRGRSTSVFSGSGFTMQVTVLALLGKTEKLHGVPGVRLQGDGIKAEPLTFLGVD